MGCTTENVKFELSNQSFIPDRIVPLLVLSRVSEYSNASLLHCQNEYTLLDSINRKHKKKSKKNQ